MGHEIAASEDASGPSGHASTDPIDADWSAGSVLAGRYRILDRLGKGGFGTVFRALDEQTNHEAAIKTIHDRAVGGAGVIRFKREYRAAARLRHPNCVQVFDLGFDRGRWYFTMEYVPGGPVSISRALPLHDAIAIGLHILAALDHLHAKQVIHGDIKPGNILLLDPIENGKPICAKLADFGIARMALNDERTVIGEYRGTMRYVSPEQAYGQLPDVRSDIYSLGVLLYELITAKPVFDLGEGDVSPHKWLELHRSAPVIPVRTRRAEAPEVLTALIEGMLQKDPRRRFNSAAKLYDQLHTWLRATMPGYAFTAPPPLERRGFLATPSICGRQPEIDSGRRFVDAVVDREGPGQLALAISGEAGIGKSTVARAIIDYASTRGAEIFVAVCPAETCAPYEPVLSLVMWNEPSPGASSETVADPGAITAALPDGNVRPGRLPTADANAAVTTPIAGNHGALGLRDRNRDESDDAPERRANSRLELHRRTLARLVAAARDRPLLLVIEDTQWSDSETLDLLSYIVRHAMAGDDRDAAHERPRLGVLLTHRPTSSEAHAALLREIEREPHSGTISLSPLGHTSASDIIASMLMVDRDSEIDAVASRISEVAGGNPLYIAQTLHSAFASEHIRTTANGWDLRGLIDEQASLPLTIRSAINERSARLSVGTQHVLAIASVIGKRVPLALLESIANVEHLVVLDHLDEAVTSGFLRELPVRDHSVFAFTHDRFRETVYSGIPQPARANIHAAVATNLERQLPNAPEVAATIAHHHVEAGNDEQAMVYFDLGARHAMKHNAFSHAAALYTQALSLGERLGISNPEAVEGFGDACLQIGRMRDARSAYGQRLQSLEQAVPRAKLLVKMAEVEARGGSEEQAAARLEEVLVELDAPTSGGNVVSTLRIPWLLATTLINHFVPALRPRRRSTTAHQRMLVQTYVRASEALYFISVPRGLYYLVRGLRMAERLGPGPELGRALSHTGFACAFFGLHRLAESIFRRARTMYDRDSQAVWAWGEFCHGLAHLCAARIDDSLERFEASAHLMQRSKEPVRLPNVWTVHADALLAAGRIVEAEQLARRLRQLAPEVSDAAKGWSAHIQGQIAARRGDYGAAEEWLRQSLQYSLNAGNPTFVFAAKARLVQTLTFAGRIDDAVELAHDFVTSRSTLTVRYPATVADGALMAACAMLCTNRPVATSSVRRTVARSWMRSWQLAASLKPTAVSRLAGQAAWLVATERSAAGGAMFDRAIRYARQHGLRGELLDVHRLAAQIYVRDSQQRTRHEEALAQLRNELELA